MFGFLSDVVESVVDTTVNTVDDFVSDPIGYTAEVVLQPVVDTVEVLEGLTEGELRERAILRLGVDAVSGMVLGEVVSFLAED